MRKTVRAILPLIFGLLLFSGCKGKVYPALYGTWVAPPVQLDTFTLLTDSGPVNSTGFEGQLVVLAFGYTHCPDACPTTMARLAKAMQLLGDEAKNVQVVLISVDTARDTPALLGRYVHAFNPDFIGATIEEPGQEPLYKALGIFVEKASSDGTTPSDAEAPATSGYLVDHTTSTAVLDRSGNWQLVWNFEVTAEEMADDLRTLINR
ncbi:MAG: SCO family protein [Bacteroidota bacterium]